MRPVVRLPAPMPAPPPAEELANALTHGVGLLLSLGGAGALVWATWLRGDAWRLASAIIYGASLVILFAASTCYHAARRPALKQFLRVVDHCAIYLMIAGSYTPILLITLRGPLGWSLLGLVWTLAFAGILFKLLYTGRFPLVSTFTYLALGWIALLAIKPIVAGFSLPALGWALAGGLAYTLGVVFYHADERVPFFHALWHLFVLVGSACHFYVIGRHVLGATFGA